MWKEGWRRDVKQTEYATAVEVRYEPPGLPRWSLPRHEMDGGARRIYDILEKRLGRFGYDAETYGIEGYDPFTIGDHLEQTTASDAYVIERFVGELDQLNDFSEEQVDALYERRRSQIDTDTSSLVWSLLPATISTVAMNLLSVVAPGPLLWQQTFGSYFDRIKELAEDGEAIHAAVMAHGGEKAIDTIYDDVKEQMGEEEVVVEL
jgi:hypothetical protein